MSDGLEDFLKKIQQKLDDNPDLQEEIVENMARISEILGAEIDFQIKYYPNLDEYEEIYDDYVEGEDLLPASDEIMEAGELVGILNNEELNLKLSIDPINLKHGINDITDFLVTTYENKLILVPVIEKKDE